MQIRDLGKIDAPVLLFGGVYGNLQALEALLDVANTLGVVPVCTGDIVAYCADGEACCQLFQRENIVTIAGNCERNLATGAADCGCGFEAGTACDRLSAAWFAHAQKTISSRSLAWMRDLPDRITFSHAGRRYGVLHGAAGDIARFIWPVSADIAAQIAIAEAQLGPLDGVISGHAGLGFKQGRWLNSGAIGMPPNGGVPETCFAILNQGAVRFERLAYDHKAAKAAMEVAGLTQGYEKTLASGWWPSEDTLPKRLKRGGVFPAPAL